MPRFLATAMHEHWSPMSNPATDMLHDLYASSQGLDQQLFEQESVEQMAQTALDRSEKSDAQRVAC